MDLLLLVQKLCASNLPPRHIMVHPRFHPRFRVLRHRLLRQCGP